MSNLLLSEAEIRGLWATTCEAEWNRACDRIKAARGGVYPDDWYREIVLSGVLATIRDGWAPPRERGEI